MVRHTHPTAHIATTKYRRNRVFKANRCRNGSTPTNRPVTSSIIANRALLGARLSLQNRPSKTRSETGIL